MIRRAIWIETGKISSIYLPCFTSHFFSVDFFSYLFSGFICKRRWRNFRRSLAGFSFFAKMGTPRHKKLTFYLSATRWTGSMFCMEFVWGYYVTG